MSISIFILGLKGGIGKSRLSYELSKYISGKKFKKVLLIDNDSLSTLSNVLGHYGDGLLDGFDLRSSLKEIDGIFMLKLRNKVYLLDKSYDNERLEQLKSILSRNWDYIIVDNYVGILEENPIIRSIYEFSHTKIGIFISDDLSLDSTIRYSISWNQLDSKHVILINRVYNTADIIDKTILDLILNQNVTNYVEGLNVRRTDRADIS
ncbi:ParA family protein [Sulfolobus sp. E11-6]|uniref:ParA family protein n=1 Tax=Sulfolobus sp. E11-6 TaxID=2663020 RepID=UPI00129518D9|nr:ParA family protein [Sulfolobus sp. E11-6]QGA68711.1 ParA family protein [Sulfolobus sp. E11-6]